MGLLILTGRLCHTDTAGLDSLLGCFDDFMMIVVIIVVMIAWMITAIVAFSLLAVST